MVHPYTATGQSLRKNVRDPDPDLLACMRVGTVRVILVVLLLFTPPSRIGEISDCFHNQKLLSRRF